MLLVHLFMRVSFKTVLYAMHAVLLMKRVMDFYLFIFFQNHIDGDLSAALAPDRCAVQ